MLRTFRAYPVLFVIPLITMRLVYFITRQVRLREHYFAAFIASGTFAAVGVPIVATYTGFVFWVFRGKVRLDDTSH